MLGCLVLTGDNWKSAGIAVEYRIGARFFSAVLGRIDCVVDVLMLVLHIVYTLVYLVCVANSKTARPSFAELPINPQRCL